MGSEPTQPAKRNDRCCAASLEARTNRRPRGTVGGISSESVPLFSAFFPLCRLAHDNQVGMGQQATGDAAVPCLPYTQLLFAATTGEVAAESVGSTALGVIAS
jgi:hypothetical protein